MMSLILHYKDRYFKSYYDRTVLSSAGSFVSNIIVSIAKLILGFVLQSPWFITTAIYSLVLCSAKGQVLYEYALLKRCTLDDNTSKNKQLMIFQRSGIFVCITGIAYLFVCIRMYVFGSHTTYPYYLVYGIAGVAFFKIYTSIYGIIVSRKIKNPIISTLKIFSFIDATVTIVMVQCALIELNGTIENAIISSSLFGIACSILFIIIGITMILKKCS
ncbi:MAG: hypothetical protein RR738_03515 [Anaerorhabdus sp.]|uniref:hypothetical protein n=1 Tax=Anaerorhabdus sp. TaxID=1872524 RepID=UPI002FCAF5DA